MRAPLLIAAAVAASPLRCGPPPRDERPLSTGPYAYEAAVPIPGRPDSLRLAGIVHVDASTPDSLHGRVAVPGLAARWREARFDVVGWRVVVPLAGDSATALVHSLRRDGRTVRCHVGASSPGTFVEGRCTLRPTAP